MQNVPTQWSKALSQFEFENNISRHASTRLTPFEAAQGSNPLTPLTRTLHQCSTQWQQSHHDVERKKAYTHIARDNLAAARSKQKFRVDKKRKDVQYSQGDWLMLHIEALQLSYHSHLPRKWRAKCVGPLAITKVMGSVNYEIEVPPTMTRDYNAFHVSKLKPYIPPKGGVPNVSVVIDVSGTTEEVVRSILGCKKEGRQIYCSPHLEGDLVSEPIWLPKIELKHVKSLSVIMRPPEELSFDEDVKLEKRANVTEYLLLFTFES